MSTNLEDLIMRDTRANQPEAGVPGRLYYVTDEEILERDNGASWDSVEGTGTGSSPAGGWIDAEETWTYASADDPTFTFTISGDVTTKYSPGMRVRLVQTTTKYFIITAVEYGAPNTTITIYGGTDYDLADAAITSPFFSREKAPFGLPLNPDKWTVEYSSTSALQQTNPTQNVWYNPGPATISVPIGIWDVSYSVNAQHNASGSVNKLCWVTLSTANNSESDNDFTSLIYLEPAAVGTINVRLTTSKILVLAAKASYYLNIMTSANSNGALTLAGDYGTTFIRARCAYL